MSTIASFPNQRLFSSLAYMVENLWFSLYPQGYMYPVEPTSTVLKSSLESYGYTVLLKRDERGRRVLEKRLRYYFPNILSIFLRREAWMYAVCSKFAAAAPQLRIPKLYSLKSSRHEMHLSREYIEGKQLRTFPLPHILPIVAQVLEQLRVLGNAIQEKVAVPRRSALTVFLTTFIYFGVALVRNPAGTKKYLYLLSLFLKNISLYDLFFPTYVFTHRDLNPDNILLNKGEPCLIDLESAIWAEEQTDLCFIARMYSGFLPTALLLDFLVQQLPARDQKRRFLRLSSHYTLQFLAVEEKQDSAFTEALRYVETLKTKIVPTLLPEPRSLYELGNSVILTTLAVLEHKTGFRLRRDRSVMLCYHSISTDHFRFATSEQSFREQMTYVNAYFRVLSVDEYVKKRNGKKYACISFDDGYQDNLTVAAPILARLNIRPILFALSDVNHARRSELYNRIPLLSDDGLRQLREASWDIGSHTATHKNIFKLSKSALVEEVTNSRTELERIIGNQINFFSYPKGGYNHDIVKLVAESGYQAAFTVDGACWGRDVDVYRIPRISIEGDLRWHQFQALLSNCGIRYHACSIRFLQAKESISQILRLSLRRHRTLYITK